MRQRLMGLPRMNVVARRYIERARSRDIYVSELENDLFRYRVEIAGQGYYMNTLDEVSAFLWGRYGGVRKPVDKVDPRCE